MSMGFDVLGKWEVRRSELSWLGKDAPMATRVNKPGCHPPRDPPGLPVRRRALPLPYPAASSPEAWGGSWFSCATSAGSHCGKLRARTTLALPHGRARLCCQVCGAPPAITHLSSGKPRKALRHLPSRPACTTPLAGDQVGARPCRLSSQRSGTGRSLPSEPAITAGPAAPAALIVLGT